MTRDERKKVENFFLRLKSNFSQTLFSNVGNFFISSRKLFPLSRVKFYANAILKCRQFFLSQVGIFSFVSSQILRKCYSQTSAIFFILSPKFFPSSRLKMTKGKNFWLKIKKLPTFENNVCVKFDSRQRTIFPTWDKKIANIWE